MPNKEGIDLEKIDKELIEYGFDLDDNYKREIAELVYNGVSTKEIKKGLIEDVAEEVWIDLNDEYKFYSSVVAYINIEKFIENREKEYKLKGQAYKDVVDFLEDRKKRLYL